MITTKTDEEEFPHSVLKSPKTKHLKPKIKPNFLILNNLNESEEPTVPLEDINYSENIKKQNSNKKEKTLLNCLIERKESSKTFQDSKDPSRNASECVCENKDELLIIDVKNHE